LTSENAPKLYIQLAVNGEWERACRLYPPPAHPEPASFRPVGDLALEIFFPDHIEQPLHAPFVGIRFERGSRILRAKFLRDVVDAVQSRRVATPAQVASWMSHRLQQRLFQGIPDRCELGIVNSWRSLESLRIQVRPGNGWIDHIARAAPHLLELTATPVAVEFAFTTPRAHWWALPVSAPEASGYRLDQALLEAALAGFVQHRTNGLFRSGAGEGLALATRERE
jgi:hypothetical protein